jgi:hypothetical protein
MRCPACTSSRLTAIQIRLARRGTHLRLLQAREWKDWFKEGADVPWARSSRWPANAGSEPAGAEARARDRARQDPAGRRCLRLPRGSCRSWPS